MLFKHRLSTAADLRRLFSRGYRIESSLFRLVILKSNRSDSRLVCIASRTVSKRAVIRNRLRRRAREWYRRQPDPFRAPVDLAIIFKKEASTAARKTLYDELSRTAAQIRDRI